jgi:hypothetical protein
MPSDSIDHDEDVEHAEHVSRRSVILGLGAAAGAAGAAAAVAAWPGYAAADSAWPGPASAPAVPEALSAPIPGLTYIAIDAQQFFPSKSEDRVEQDIDLTGSKPATAPNRIWAGLPIPAGSTVHQIHVGYVGQPIAEISRRPLTQPSGGGQIPQQVFQRTLDPSPGGPFSSSELLSTPVTIEREASYTVSFYLLAGSAVFGCSIGYLPPTQSFVPFTGTPRVLDTREPGPLTGKLGPGEERIVDLGIAGARSAVLNLTVTETVEGGFVAVFPTGITWPGNSSINWSSSNQNVANGVITAVDGLGRITIRGGSNPTHVVIDRIGYMI